MGALDGKGMNKDKTTLLSICINDTIKFDCACNGESECDC